MGKLVFDIETVGVEFDALDAIQQAYWLQSCETPEQIEHEKASTGLSPLTGFVCCIALLNPDTCKAKVYSLGNLPTTQADDASFVYMPDEAALLSAFWRTVTKYDQLISFNGRSFDVPFLMLRSAIHHIRPTRNLLGYRYQSDKHCDLADQLGFYGATRRLPLHFYLKAFGIPTSKEGGIDGSQVMAAFQQGRIQEIAAYCLRDVIATAELFKAWDAYLNVP